MCRKNEAGGGPPFTPDAARPPIRSTRVWVWVQASSRLPSSTSSCYHNLADSPRPGGRRHGRPAPRGPRARAQRFLRQARGADPRAVLRSGRAEPRVEQVQQNYEREGAGQARGEGKLQEGAPREAPAGRAIDAGEDQEQGARRFWRRGRRRLRLGRVGGRRELVRLRERHFRRGKEGGGRERRVGGGGRRGRSARGGSQAAGDSRGRAPHRQRMVRGLRRRQPPGGAPRAPAGKDRGESRGAQGGGEPGEGGEGEGVARGEEEGEG